MGTTGDDEIREKRLRRLRERGGGSFFSSPPFSPLFACKVAVSFYVLGPSLLSTTGASILHGDEH